MSVLYKQRICLIDEHLHLSMVFECTLEETIRVHVFSGQKSTKPCRKTSFLMYFVSLTLTFNLRLNLEMKDF